MLGNVIKNEWKDMDLNYTGENNFSSFFSSEGNIHSYPAKVVPEVVNSLLIKLKELYNIKSVLDPFVGSGTIALESKYLGLDFYGSDLNPLAILLAKTKVLTIKKTQYIKNRILEFADEIIELYVTENVIPLEIFDNIDYWFKEQNIRELSYIKRKIESFLKSSKKYRREFSLIILTAFSSTIRDSSLSRNGEFKLYRMSPNDIDNFNINSIYVFKEKINNILNMLVFVNNSYIKDSISEIYMENAKSLSYLEDGKVDLVITSPPYGDSQSTVAYGQFSKLSIQWMGDLLKKYLQISYNTYDCDQHLLGGKKSQIDTDKLEGFYKSDILNNLIIRMDQLIIKEVEKNQIAKNVLQSLIKTIKENQEVSEADLKANFLLSELIKERIRLVIFRKLNHRKSKIKNQKIKKRAMKLRDIFFKQLFSDNKKRRDKRIKQLQENLPFITETIDRKIQTQPKRKQEVIDFFKDLYTVVLETDRVLSKDGVQTWIVGHRTVMGEIVVNMEGILKEWFLNKGYTLVTSLERKYSFKRMPHHINSTISRKEQVQTMMNEYILIVKK